LPASEITRLTELGFLEPIDGGKPDKGKALKVKPVTGIPNDPRIAAR
jgi:hypothetical protein